MSPADPATIMRDFDILEAVHALHAGGFRTSILEKGTICAYKGERCYDFGPRYGRYGREAIGRAIEDCRGPPSPEGNQR